MGQDQGTERTEVTDTRDPERAHGCGAPDACDCGDDERGGGYRGPEWSSVQLVEGVGADPDGKKERKLGTPQPPPDDGR